MYPDLETRDVPSYLRDAILENPGDALAQAQVGHWLHTHGDYMAAGFHLSRALVHDPNFAHAHAAVADLRATCPEPTVRDAGAAVHHAKTAYSLADRQGQLDKSRRHRMYLRVLAAAQAEAGDFSSAISTAQKALDFTVSRIHRGPISDHISQYLERKPIRADRGILEDLPRLPED